MVVGLLDAAPGTSMVRDGDSAHGKVCAVCRCLCLLPSFSFRVGVAITIPAGVVEPVAL